MKELIVGVSGINAMENPGPGVGVARSLKADSELPIKIVGLAYDALEPGNYLDWLIDKVFIMPYPSSGHDAYFERLNYIKQSFGLDFIIPNLDAELPLYTNYASEIEELGIKTFVPNREQYRLRSKDRLPEVAERINLAIPQTLVVNSGEALSQAIEEIGLPIMVKGAFYQAYRAYSAREAEEHFQKLVDEWGYPVILQKVVSGEEMNVVGVGDGAGGNVGQVGIKKTSVTSLGKIWTGITVKNELMLKASENFVREYRWPGPFELECIVDGDTVYLIEINPRFPAWTYFATGVGLNLPAALVRLAFGLPLTPICPYEAGELFIRYTYEIVTHMNKLQDLLTKGETPYAGEV
ncbi:MAG: ATP-grasp domain-containing protein [Deltaproteobacteria bacterium]|nr:ATP-grasp domain-containing protein [Deltaproteobacteria bacterium]